MIRNGSCELKSGIFTSYIQWHSKLRKSYPEWRLPVNNAKSPSYQYKNVTPLILFTNTDLFVNNKKLKQKLKNK